MREPDDVWKTGAIPADRDGPYDPERALARRYAHFHRVLAELLTELSESEQTFWVTSDRHRITPTGAHNRYAKAVYLVRDLTGYEPSLVELERIRSEALALIGTTSPTQSLLLPKACREVDRARILENTGFSSRPRKRTDVLERLARRREEAIAARETFESYADREEKRLQIDRELAEIEAGIAALGKVSVDALREHYRYPRYMCHVHYRDPGAFDQLYIGDAGVILQGRHAEVSRHDPKRRRHRRTIGVEPVAVVGAYVFYEEEAWRAARERS